MFQHRKLRHAYRKNAAVHGQMEKGAAIKVNVI